MVPARVTFRGKILLALVGTVLLLVGTSLLVVRHQTQRQVLGQVDRATDRAATALAEVERLRNEELERFGRRFTGSIRLPAAMDAALDADDSDVLAEAAEYELELAGMDRGLVVFSDADGRLVAVLRDGRVAPEADEGQRAPGDAGETDVGPLVRTLLEEGEERLTGYHLEGGVLYTVHVYPLILFDRLVGALTLGFPFEDDVAGRLGEVVGAEVCFAVEGLCVAGTEGFGTEDFVGALPGLDPADELTTMERDGARWALVANSVPAGAGPDVRQVLAVSLDEVLLPFDRIQSAVWVVGLGALLLSLLLGVVLSRGLARPVRALVGATERVRRGEYDFRVEVPSRDELGTLGEAFNEMIRDLGLKEKYRGVLDKVVSRDVAEEMLKGEVRLGGEVREVSTLFADVRGFTSIAEGLEPTEVVAMLNEWFDRAAAAVEAEGGVVDKFLGDGIMAIFGAPIAQEDHAPRAVRAALRMRDELEELNRRRTERGAAPLEAGIGISTGRVVAGNTGSQDRLNYTVLGEAVNLAARLCSEAGPGEILVSDATRQGVGEEADALEQAPRRVKGLSYEVRPWLVRSLVSGVASLFLAGLAAPADAQRFVPDPPTLQELGIEYLSPTGFFQITPSGRLDVALHHPGDAPPWLIPETETFVGGHLRFFTDVFVGDRTFASTELRADRGDEPRAASLTGRIQQAFVRVRLADRGSLHLQAGKFITPFGNHPGRRRTEADPFIRPPLHHDHRTVLGTDRVPGAVDGLLDWKDEPGEFRADGAPVVWGTPYPSGAMALGGHGALSFRLAVLNSMPASDPDQWSPDRDDFRDPAVVAHLGFQPRPELHVGASWGSGPYLRRGVEDPGAEPGTPVPDDRFRDFDQRLASLEATVTRGMVELRGEVVRNVWQVPNVEEDAVDVSWFAEGKLKSRGGLFGAARVGAIHFNKLTASTGEEEVWDHDVGRWQVAGGYRLARNMELRAEYLRNHTDSPIEADTDLLSLEIWWRF